MSAINSDMIKLARESRGLSQSDLCNLLGVAQGTVSKIENGLMQPSSEIVENLSIKLDYPVNFFLQADKVYSTSYIYYRRKISMARKNLSTSEAKMNVLRLGLQKLLDGIDLPETNLFSWNVEDHGTPEDAARLLRDRWKVPRGKIENLTKLIEDNGIIIVPFDFGAEKIDGISMYTEKNQPVIYINRKLPTDRFRLTIAHELGHLVMHFKNPISERRDVEREAFAFGSEFLVPAEEFTAQVSYLDFKMLTNLKLYWRVSMASLVMKAKLLAIITDNQAKYLWAQLSAMGFRLQEPPELSPPREDVGIIKEILQVYKSDYNYTDEDLCKIVQLNSSDFYNYYISQEGCRLRVVK
ncbi:XRE family transcriptional regulator [uncultured Chitinophaga sp.]|uniref:helix-turn-helix domain-containing protein n=1 Tax=uncultured Chitinophaga sp. TaxID=339340 RepID=UPI0025D1C078|nr:XRE family transcriptional regulator [uncultured Chitinophaga sp.]